MKANHLHVIGLLLLFSLGHFWATFRVFAPTAPPRRHFHRAPIRLKEYRPAESSLVGGEGVGRKRAGGLSKRSSPSKQILQRCLPRLDAPTPPRTSRGLSCPPVPRERPLFRPPPPRRPQGMFLDPARTLVPFIYSSISIGIAIRGMGGDDGVNRAGDDFRTGLGQ